MTTHYCKAFIIIKDEGHAEILLCEICGRKYRKYWDEDLTQMHVLNEDYISNKEMEARYNKKLMVVK